MREAQKYYLETPSISFGVGVKHYPKDMQEEINTIHLIQKLSIQLEHRGFDEKVWQELVATKTKYEKMYGEYKIQHYQREEEVKQMGLF